MNMVEERARTGHHNMRCLLRMVPHVSDGWSQQSTRPSFRTNNDPNSSERLTHNDTVVPVGEAGGRPSPGSSYTDVKLGNGHTFARLGGLFHTCQGRQSSFLVILFLSIFHNGTRLTSDL